MKLETQITPQGVLTTVKELKKGLINYAHRRACFSLTFRRKTYWHITVYQSAFKPLTKIHLQQQNDYPNHLSQHHLLHYQLLQWGLERKIKCHQLDIHN